MKEIDEKLSQPEKNEYVIEQYGKGIWNMKNEKHNYIINNYIIV